jgi:hypothetical protein
LEKEAMAVVPGGRALRGIIPLLVSAALLFGFYVWTASAGHPLGLGEPHEQLYDLLARSLLHGQLHLDVEPRPELFELTQPYHHGRNDPYRLHDASLYRGRYYLYFGVVPVLAAFVPWRLAGLGDLPEPAAAAVFSLVGFVFSALLLRHLLRRHLDAPPGPIAQVLAFLILGLSNVTPFILRSSHVYEVAIAAGYAFSAGAAWLLATAAGSGGLSLTRLALGGLFLGLAVGCRPNLVLLVPVLPFLALAAGRPRSIRETVRPALALLAPLAVCGLALGLYNMARFDSWTEFGTRYQLTGVPPIPQYEMGAVLPALYYAFVAPPALRIDFPFIFPDHGWAGSLPEGYFLDSSTTGVFFHSPFVLILLALPWILRGAPVREPKTLRRDLLVLTAAGLVIPSVTAFAFASTAMRFQADYAHFLVVAALVLWFVLAARMGGRRGRSLFKLVVAFVFGWSAFAAVGISLTGVDPLRRSNPELFAALERKARSVHWLVRLLARDTRAVEHLRVAFPERTVEEREPFLSWGRVERYDVLWVRTASPGVFIFTLDTDAGRSRPAASRPRSPAVGFAAGRFYDVAVEIDRLERRVSLSVDGRERFALEGRLVPVDSREVWPGRGPRGHGARNIGHFSGTMIPEDMWLAGPPGLESLPPISEEPAILTATRTPPPRPATPGRLWAVAGHKGAWIDTGDEWRWIPAATLGAVAFEAPVEDLLRTGADDDVVPILTSGGAEGADAVVGQREGDGRVAVAFARWAGKWTLGERSPPMALVEGDTARLRVVLDRRAHEVLVRRGEREVLRVRTELRPIRPQDLLIARTPR